MTFTWVPDFGANATRTPKVKKIQFGDTYEQRQGEGINTLVESWSLTFSKRDITETSAIDSFLITCSGITSFVWTPPNETVSKKYVCRTWRKSIDTPVTYTVTATFEQVFEP